MARKQIAPKSFEEAQRELDAIVTQIEAGSISLEESLEKYERGVFLVQFCRGVLQQAEKQIDVLSRGEDGAVKSAPEPLPTSDEHTQD